MIVHTFFRHIHQGGTLLTYCGRPVRATDVSWEGTEGPVCPSCSRALGEALR